jgi:hypothetical protein
MSQSLKKIKFKPEFNLLNSIVKHMGLFNGRI